MSEWVFTVVFTSAVVASFAAVSFNQPSWSRSFTTAARFRFGAAAHVALYMLVLAVAYALMRRMSSSRAEDALMSAMLVTLAIRGLPPVSRRLREWIHRLAGIPDSAQRLGRLLAEADFAGGEAIRAEARDVLLKRGVDVSSDWLPITQPVQKLLFRSTMLFLQLRGWEQDRRYARFVTEARHDIDLLRHRFDRMSFRVSRALASIERLGELRFLHSQHLGDAQPCQQFDEAVRALVSDLIADSCEDIDAFYEDACLLAARGALSTCWTRKGRDALIARLGFVRERVPLPRRYGILIWTAVLLFGGIWLYFNILPTDASELSLKARISVVTMIVFGAFAIAIVPKLRWGFANSGLHERTPVDFVVAAGIGATLFAIAVNLAAGAIIFGGVSGALDRLAEGAPYLPAAFGTSAAVAYLIQDHRWARVASPALRRLRDAGTVAGVWVLASFAAVLLRSELQGAAVDEVLLASAVSGSLVLGGVLGYVIPENVRDNELLVASQAVAHVPGRFAAEPAAATPAA